MWSTGITLCCNFCSGKCGTLRATRGAVQPVQCVDDDLQIKCLCLLCALDVPCCCNPSVLTAELFPLLAALGPTQAAWPHLPGTAALSVADFYNINVWEESHLHAHCSDTNCSDSIITFLSNSWLRFTRAACVYLCTEAISSFSRLVCSSILMYFSLNSRCPCSWLLCNHETVFSISLAFCWTSFSWAQTQNIIYGTFQLNWIYI